MRYPHGQVYLFDKGGSARAATAGVGGDYYALGGDSDALAFQPLADIDDLHERAWAAEWVEGLLVQEHVEVTPAVKDEVWRALGSLATGARAHRTLTGLAAVVQQSVLRQALRPYTLEGPHGRLLDADRDGLAESTWQCFEMEHLLHTPSVVPPVLTYLFHRLEQRLIGVPTLLILDEAWVYLDHPVFAARIREWLKVLRKLNASVIFATQSLADAAESAIAAAISESCLTRIFLPNARALEEQIALYYRRYGLNDRQLELLASAAAMQVQSVWERLTGQQTRLQTALTASDNAGGNLQVSQATNQLLGVLAEQQASLQHILAASSRAEASLLATQAAQDDAARANAQHFMNGFTTMTPVQGIGIPSFR